MSPSILWLPHQGAEEDDLDGQAGSRTLGTERRARLLSYLNGRSSATIAVLCELLDASPATVHRDLGVLARDGLIQRVRGGAMTVDVHDDPSVAIERRRNVEAKKQIARAALDLVRAGSTIFLEASTTVSCLATLIRTVSGLTVVTNSPEIALDLMGSESEVILIGGNLRRKTLATVGPLAVSALRGIRVEQAFIGVSAIGTDGVSSMNMTEAETKVAILESAGQVIGLADAEKLGRNALTRVAGLEAIDLLITNSAASPQNVQALRDKGLSVEIAGRRNDQQGLRLSDDAGQISSWVAGTGRFGPS